MATPNWTEKEKSDTLQKLAKRAMHDKTFREACLKDPRKAVKDIAGKELPADFKIRFVENNGADITVVLPDAAKKGGELSDSELEQVAGGRCGGSCGGSCVMMSS